MIKLKFAILFVLSSPPTFAATPTDAAIPPQAAQKPKANRWHGEEVKDPFFWLREKENPEVRSYLEAEVRYFNQQTAHLKPVQQKLFQQMKARLKETDVTPREKRNGWYYYERTVAGQQYRIHCRSRALTGGEKIIWDENQQGKKHKFYEIENFEVSPSGHLLALTEDVSGFREYNLKLVDLKTQAIVPTEIGKVSFVFWGKDDDTLFFGREDSAKRSYQIHSYNLKTKQATLLLEEKNEEYRVHGSISRDKKMLLVEVVASDSHELQVLSLDKDEKLRVVIPRKQGRRLSSTYFGGFFYVVTNDNAPENKLVRFKETGSYEEAETIVSSLPDTTISSVDVFESFAVLETIERGISQISFFKTNDLNLRRVKFPEPAYSVRKTANPEANTNVFRVSYSSLIRPTTVYDIDPKTLSLKVAKAYEVPTYHRDQYVSERVEVTVRDGTRVPVSLVYRKDLDRKKPAPMLLYGYGSYGFPLAPNFDANRLNFLDRGFIFAIAHIRGGGDLGESWRQNGKLKKKMNTFYDFVDVAEFFVSNKTTTPQLLAIRGRSAGGLLMGAVTNLRPDLFKVVHLGVPFVDVLNTMFDASLPLTVFEYNEWGNPNLKEDYQVIRQYCPYTNLTKRDYPAIFVTTSFNDSQVMYWEPAKYVAKMRSLKTNKTPTLFWINMDAGHGGASGRYDYLSEIADQDAVVMWQVIGSEKL